jgi:hypothetical protein
VQFGEVRSGKKRTCHSMKGRGDAKRRKIKSAKLEKQATDNAEE